MKLLLIAPSSGKWRSIGKNRFFNGKTFRFSLLGLLSLAAQTPADVEVRVVDEQVEDIPFDAQADLVGIGCMTALAPRAYEIADAFRARGVPVVLGGMHPTMRPQEALGHADAVVSGEAEAIWPHVVEDARAGRLGGLYRSEQPPCLSGLPALPRHLLDPKRYATIHAVQATRGCPHKCDFCSVSAFHHATQRQRPASDVAAEIATIPDRTFMFVDDNLTANREYAMDLFRALAPLDKRWIAQASLSIANDPELARAAAAAGCFGVFVGLETFSQETLRRSGKAFNRVEGYRESIRFLHSLGIGVEAGIVFGFDGDDPGVFRRTLKHLDDLEIDLIQVSILTPLPGTAQHERLRSRIVDEDWARYDFHSVVFEPSGMSREDLQAGHDWITREFYRPWRIMRRMARYIRRPSGWKTALQALALNWAYYGRVVRWGIQGWDPAKVKAPKLSGKLATAR